MADEELQAAPGGALEPYIAAAELEIARRFEEAELVINEWLDEADAEGAAIVARATAAAEQLLLEAHAQVAEIRATASEQAAAVLREASEQATAHRQAAADEAASLLAESRAQAERRMQEAARQADFRLAQAEAEVAAREQRAEATVTSLRADVGALQEQLVKLMNNASSMLPMLENLSGEPAPAAHGELVAEAVAEAAVEPEDVVDAEIVEPAEAPAPRRRVGLGELVPELEDEDDDAVDFDVAHQPVPHVRRGLGRLLGRR